MNHPSHRYNIAIRLQKRITGIAIAASKKFAKTKGVYMLGSKDFYPHITLYMTQFPDKNIPEVMRRISRIAKNKKPILLEAIGAPRITEGYVGVNFKKTEQIRELQKELIAALNPLREGLITDASRKQLLVADKTGKKNILRFGSQHVFTKFTPHLTLTKLKNNKDPYPQSIGAATLTLRNISFHSAAVGLFEAGKHGTCRKIVKIFRLGK